MCKPRRVGEDGSCAKGIVRRDVDDEDRQNWQTGPWGFGPCWTLRAIRFMTIDVAGAGNNGRCPRRAFLIGEAQGGDRLGATHCPVGALTSLLLPYTLAAPSGQGAHLTILTLSIILPEFDLVLISSVKRP